MIKKFKLLTKYAFHFCLKCTGRLIFHQGLSLLILNILQHFLICFNPLNLSFIVWICIYYLLIPLPWNVPIYFGHTVNEISKTTQASHVYHKWILNMFLFFLVWYMYSWVCLYTSDHDQEIELFEKQFTFTLNWFLYFYKVRIM